MNYDINKLQELLEREKIAKKICADLNHFTDLQPTLNKVIEYIKELAKCEAVAVRLYNNGDYLYYVYNGFPEEFIKKESSLCVKDEKGNNIMETNGERFVLECLCGSVISGKFDPALPCFTEKGSFWCNDSTYIKADYEKHEKNNHIRNYCNICGYMSVALIPILSQDKRIGLIQLNDKKFNVFNKDIIEFLEAICEYIGLSIYNSYIYTKLKEAYDEIKTLRGLIPICANCKNIRNDDNYWETVEEYLRKHSEAEFTHDICPECRKKLYSDFTNELDKQSS